MIKQILKAVPHSPIQSGEVVLQANETTGLIDFSYSIVAGYGWLHRTLQNMKEIQVDPTLLLSSGLKVGVAVTVADAKLEVVSNDSSIAVVSFTMNDPEYQFTGSADLDVTGQYFVVKHLLANGVVDGMSVTLELQP